MKRLIIAAAIAAIAAIALLPAFASAHGGTDVTVSGTVRVTGEKSYDISAVKGTASLGGALELVYGIGTARQLFGLQDLLALGAKATQGLPLLPSLLSSDRWLLWLGILFVLSVYFFPTGIVGKLRRWKR